MDSPEAQEAVVRAMRSARAAGERPELAFLQESKNAYRVTTGSRCVWFLLRSRRTYSSINTRLFQWTNRNNYSSSPLSSEEFENSKLISIVLRRFCSELRPELEFRGFVWNFELTAVSQLYKWLHVPEISKRRSVLPQEIVGFYDSEISHVVPADLPNFIIDFVCVNGRWMIIELNRWDRMTGPALFSWQDEDRIKSGPFMFKIISSQPVEPVDHLKHTNMWIPREL